MNVLNLYIQTFTRLHNRRFDILNIIGRMRGLLRRVALRRVPKYLSKKNTLQGRRIENLIVSFTSFPARIANVWQVVECMKRQTYLPEKIVLWLSKDQFPHNSDVPESLRYQVDNLFEIRMVDGDIRSHKKWYYTFLEYSGKSIVTIDDDVYYHCDTLKYLVDCSRLFPNCVIANNTKQITFTDGKIQPYDRWIVDVPPYKKENLVQIGVGGVLYPPCYATTPLLLDKDLFLRLTPLADDLWLNAMAKIQDVPIVQTPFPYLIINMDNGSAPSLSNVNLGQSQNDKQLSNLQMYFKEKFNKDIYSE